MVYLCILNHKVESTPSLKILEVKKRGTSNKDITDDVSSEFYGGQCSAHDLRDGPMMEGAGLNAMKNRQAHKALSAKVDLLRDTSLFGIAAHFVGRLYCRLAVLKLRVTQRTHCKNALEGVFYAGRYCSSLSVTQPGI
jgi:hypothetical protein